MSTITGLPIKEIKRILKIPSSLNSDTVMISPEVARIILLGTNKQNRKLRESHISSLTRLIKSGDWHLTQDAISFNSSGVLTNGQHRLSAIVKGGKAVPVLVAFNIDMSTAIDTGAKRSFSDNVSIGSICDESIRDITVIHRVFKTAYEYRLGYFKQVTLTPDALVELMNKYADDLKICYEKGLFGTIGTKGCNATVIKSAIFIAYLNKVDIETLQHLVMILKTGVVESVYDSPIISLRDKLIPKTGGGREVNQERFAYTQSCIYKLSKKHKSKSLDTEIKYTYTF